MLELRHIRYILAAAERGSFRGAADVLGVHPSALSRRIRDFEDEVGAALFIRTRSGISPTQAGERFVAAAQKAMSQIQEAVYDIGIIGRGEQGVVRIGLISSLSSGFLAELVEAYEASHADVRLEYMEGGTIDLVSAVAQQRIDVAFLVGTPHAPGYDCLHLWDERPFVALSERHGLAGKEELSWADLRGQYFVVSEVQPGPEIQDYLVQNLADHCYSPHVERHPVYRDTLLQMVARGHNITVTSEATIGAQFPGVVYRPLQAEALPFSALWSPRNDNPAFRRLLSLAKTLARRYAS